MIAALLSGSTISSGGYVAVFAAVTLECLGVPVPGETTLIAAGIYAGTTHRLSLFGIVAVAIAAAISGGNVGYLIGRVGGARLLDRYGHRIRLTPSRRKMLRYLFDRHGWVIVFVGRFVLIVRTYTALLAGVSRMPWRTFVVANSVGGVLWACLFGIGAYEIGNSIKRLNSTISIVFGSLAIAGLVAAMIFFRRFLGELERRAELAYPDAAQPAFGAK